MKRLILVLAILPLLVCSLAGGHEAYAFKYHDNKVSFKATNQKDKLQGGTFIINDFYVHKSQDPKGKIHIGLQQRLVDGYFTFTVGRKASKDPANWFKGKIPANQNTFDKNPKKLNFAIIGTLSLTFDAGSILGGYNDSPYVFEDIALAQGHSGATNNWWFGGRNCGGPRVINLREEIICTGKDINGNQVKFSFQRGGNKQNTIGIKPVSLMGIDTERWMSKVDETKKINEIIMPGSHDAGMSELHHCTIPKFTDGKVQTQSLNVGEQLQAGSRYFDIRVDYDHGELVTYHRGGGKGVKAKIGCNGQSLKSVLDQVVEFLQGAPTETAFLKFSHIRSDKGSIKSPEIKDKINTLLSDGKYYNAMYRNSDKDVDLTNVLLTKVRGKMVTVFDYSEHIDPGKGRFHYIDGCNKAKREVKQLILTVCDKYSNKDSYDAMKKDQLAKWDSYAGFNKDYLFLLSWTLTPPEKKPFTKSVKTLSTEANSKLPAVLYEQIHSNGKGKPNIVYIDYVNIDTNQAIIQYNFR